MINEVSNNVWKLDKLIFKNIKTGQERHLLPKISIIISLKNQRNHFKVV